MPPPLGSIWQFWHLRFADEENRGSANPVAATKKQKRKGNMVWEYFMIIQPFRRMVFAMIATRY